MNRQHAHPETTGWTTVCADCGGPCKTRRTPGRCMSCHLRALGDPTRFWSQVDQSAGSDACWLWTGNIDRQGYGRYRGTSASRFSLASALERPVDGDTRHSCDNPPCVNPAHLSEGSRGDNVRDMVARGRSTRGARNARAKLTDEVAQHIRALAPEYVGNHRALARRFGVSRQTIDYVIRGERWVA